MMRILGGLHRANSAVVCAQFRSSDKLSLPLGNFQKFSTRSIRKNCPISTACELDGVASLNLGQSKSSVGNLEYAEIGGKRLWRDLKT